MADTQPRTINPVTRKLVKPLRFALKLRLFLRERGLDQKKADRTLGFKEGRMEDICAGISVPNGGDWNYILVRLKIDPSAFDQEDFVDRGWSE